MDSRLNFPYRPIRQPLAVNLFKRMVLGEHHRAGDPQVEETRAVFLERGLADRLDWRTWSSWFKKDTPAAQRKSMQELDRLIDSFRDPDRYLDDPDATPATSLFADLATGGLIQELLRKTSSKQPLAVLNQRACEYVPASPWHLHVDALETIAAFEANGEVDRQSVKRAAARRILSLLYYRWGPRYGHVYKDLSSQLKAIWVTANQQQREALAAFCAEAGPGCFDALMNASARPRWDLIGIESDIAPIHAYRILVALAADPIFLIADRFAHWWLDLATAGLAMYALALTDAERTLTDDRQPEAIFWESHTTLFLGSEPREYKMRAMRKALKAARAPWSKQAGEVLCLAGAQYQSALGELGVGIESAAVLAQHYWKKLPVVYGQ